MFLPLKYNLRSLMVRRTSTTMTAVSIGLVVAVSVGIMALARGIDLALVATGDPRNVILLRKGSLVETSSTIPRDALQVIRYLDGIEVGPAGQPHVSPELVVLVNLRRAAAEGRSNVTIRGLTPTGMALRPEVRIVRGQPFRPGVRELMVSRTLAARFRDLGLGDRVRLGKSTWTVAGYFDATGTAHDSEIWADVHELAEDFDRTMYSAVLLRPTDPGAGARLIAAINEDQRLHMRAMTERAYYMEQTKSSRPIKALGTFLAGVMAIGACFAAMNTMYAAVATRAREISILRTLGFPRGAILASFLIESLILAGAGGVLGCLLALPLNGLTTGTTNFRTFSELAFAFRVTPRLLGAGLAFAGAMGLLGGLLPARLAARQALVRGLRDAGAR
jgi:putative ABC transport system permease protein